MEIELINAINKNNVKKINNILIYQNINFENLTIDNINYQKFVFGLRYLINNSLKSKNLIRYYSKYNFSYYHLGILYLGLNKYNKSFYYLNKIEYEEILYILSKKNKVIKCLKYSLNFFNIKKSKCIDNWYFNSKYIYQPFSDHYFFTIKIKYLINLIIFVK